MANAPPSDGGRRSRRGYAYQDAVTLLDCLDMHAGAFDEVSFEALDDIVCVSGDHAVYRQVKTKEDSTRHSVATVCQPEIKDRADTSILGRLFTGKRLTENTRFCLLLNETPLSDLNDFRVDRQAGWPQTTEVECADLARRLTNLELPEGVTLSWYIARFHVMVEARTIDQVEAVLIRRLNTAVSDILGQRPLQQELEDILRCLADEVSRDAAAVAVRAWNSADFAAKLSDAVAWVTGRRPDGGTDPLPTLASKLGKASIPPEEAQRHTDMLLRYRRRYRSAVGDERLQLDHLNDHVFALCSDIAARRRAGEIAEGAASYAATMQAVGALQIPSAPRFSLLDKVASLHDVTARCQNRYADGP
ncbi:dsDNA nuclease domain-containing protein [Pseudofrankia sp. BMG5.36]|uniref:dsDNA nuclease domain-containing protein n=1 Tax=Pseudofrankia sp. BMG5.36 TaxID=1834512 RepID=UPI0009F6DA91|nr:dsDNA nuclease domain-containing protein [Pseudofrankia sp. BMG5.36]